MLPPVYEVVKADGTVMDNRAPPPAPERLEWVWNDIWRRRVNYFMTVSITAVLVLFLPSRQMAAVGLRRAACLVTRSSRRSAPSSRFLQPWIEAFAISPGWFLLVVLIILVP